jgi:hypothetical protein
MPNTYTLLETITVGAATASSVTFNSIPQTGYTDLVIKASCRSTIAEDTFGIRFNSDSGSNYLYRGLVGTGAATSAFNGTNTFVALGRQSESGYTAGVFGNNEFYILNYTSANKKSVSVDAVNENNSSTARTQIATSLWSGTAAITTIQVLPSSGAFAQYSTFSLYGVSALGVTPTKAPKATGGSIIQTDGTYWYHAFLSSGTFTPATGLSCDVLVVAGGGGGGKYIAGGGGAGGFRAFTSQSVSTAQTVTVGGGGAGATTGINGASGSDSVFGSNTSSGGGGGAQGGAAGTAGGSGGGGAYTSNIGGAGNTPSTSPSQGNNGGTAAGPADGAAGGGGAGAVGTSRSVGGAGGGGGIGVNTYSSWLSTTGLGVSGYVAGGGGGGANGFAAGAGGTGGGGAGASVSLASTAGTANTGGGGGGGSSGAGALENGAAGGSGLVIVRYLA